jgi:hypothetical protein
MIMHCYHQSNLIIESLNVKKNLENNISDIEIIPKENIELRMIGERSNAIEYRYKSFENFEWDSKFTTCYSRELAEAGFNCEFRKDIVKCYYCGLALCNWRNGAYAFNEHNKYSPGCSFVKYVKKYGDYKYYNKKEFKSFLGKIHDNGEKETTV